MDVTLTGYRLRPATTAPDGSTRWIGTRESDGTRVAVLVRPGEEDDRAGYAGLHLPGVLTLAEVHAVPGGCALLYADPPAHTLEDLIADGPICASGVVEVLLTLHAALAGLAGRGQGHPVLDAGGVWVDADGSVLLGDVGGWPADPDPVAAQRCLLQLGTTLLADVAPLDAGVARLGLDAVEEVRRELADALVRWQHQVETSGQPLDDLEQRLRAVCEPAPPRIPVEWGRQASDLAGMLRALARADDPDPGSRSRFSSARFTIRSPRAGATTTAGEGPPVHSATAAPARRGRRAGPPARGRLALRRTGGQTTRHTTRLMTQQATRQTAPDNDPFGLAHDEGLGERALAAWDWLCASPIRYLAASLAVLLVSAGAVLALRPDNPQTLAPAPFAASSATTQSGPGPSEREPVPSASPQSTPAQSTPAQSPTARTTPDPGSRTAAPADPVRARSGALDEPKAVVQALADLRAQAWTDLDARALVRLNAGGSPAADADDAALARARRDDLAYEGLRFTVRSATARAIDGADRRVRVRAVLDASEFTITDANGRTTTVPAAPHTQIVFDLAWSGSRWQVRDLREA